MEKILSKELLLQNLNSSNLFVVKACMLKVFNELLQGKQGLLTMQDIVFSQKSEVKPEEFFKCLGKYFIDMPKRDAQKWDNFFNILEQRRSYMPISRMVVLEMYLYGNLNKEEKHRCCFWLNNHCQFGQHKELILKMLSSPEDAKLLLLAKKYCRQEYAFSQEEVDKVCSLPLRAPRKLEIYALFIAQKNQNFNFCVLKELMQNLSDDKLMATSDEKRRMWNMVIGLLQTNPLDEVITELKIDVRNFNQLYQQGKIDKDIYLNILKAFAEQISFVPTELKDLLEGYAQIAIIEKNRHLLKPLMDSLFLLLEKKNPRITDKVLTLVLEILLLWKEKQGFNVSYLSKIRAKIYQGAMLIKKANISELKQCLTFDENLFLLLVPKVEESDIKALLQEVAHQKPELWSETLDAVLSKTLTDIMLVVEILAEMYKAENTADIRKILAESLTMLLNNLPEKEAMAEKADKFFAFMNDNPSLKSLVESYLKNANVAMANYLIG